MALSGWCRGILLGLLGGLLGAQALDPAKRLTEYRVERWDSRRGFPGQAATDMVQSRTGHLWITTFNGLARFDGMSFRVFQPANTPQMDTGNLWSLVEDREGALWFSTTGKELFRCVRGAVTRVPLEGAVGNFMTLALDAADTLWIGSNAGLFQLQQGHLHSVPELGKADITALHLDREGRLWIATRRKGLWVREDGHIRGPFQAALPDQTPELLALAQTLDGSLFVGTLNRGVLTLRDGVLEPPPWADSLAEPIVGALLGGAKGELWIGGSKGLHRMVENVVQHLGSREGFPEERIQSLAQDQEGNLWVGSWREGLIRLTNGKFRVFTRDGGLPHNTVLSTAEDSQGVLWVGTTEGLARLGPDGCVAVDAINQRLPKAKEIKDMAWDRQGTLWISNQRGLFQVRGQEVRPVLTASGQPLAGVRVILEARKGGLWLGTTEGLLAFRDGRAERISTRELLGQEPFILSLCEDTAGRLWIGTQGHGLLLLEDGRFRAFTPRDGLPAGSVFRVTPDGDGSLWIGTGNGLARFHDGRFQSIDYRQGIRNGTIYQALLGPKDDLWILGELGFCRLAKAEVLAALEGRIPRLQARLFNEGDGLRMPGCTSVGKGLTTRDGRIAIPTPGGLVVAEPGPLPFNPIPPPVSIDALVREQVETLFPEGWQTLPAGSRGFEIHYSAPSLAAPEMVRFRHRLEGLETTWQESGSRRFAVYSQVDPGAYRFQVIACNNDGIWNSVGAHVAIYIEPRFHQTWGFRLALLGLVGAAVLALHRLRLRQLKARAKALELLVEARTAELETANEALRNQSLTDPLTGLKNRRFLGVSMPDDVARVNRAHRQAAGADRQALNIDLVFIMVDVDHFKSVNDAYGHHGGDLVLQSLAAILRGATRDTDTVVRWGGEEFLVVARNANRKDGALLAERIRSQVECSSFDVGNGQTLQRTCSLGFAVFPLLSEHPEYMPWELVVDLADQCLYAAKRNGRNAWVGLVAPREVDPGALRDNPLLNIPEVLARGTLEVTTSFPAGKTLDWDLDGPAKFR